MANKKHLSILKQGVEVWNNWKKENRLERPVRGKVRLNLGGCSVVKEMQADLQGADLGGAKLIGADLTWTNLERTSLEDTNLEKADFAWSSLAGACLKGANLEEANLELTTLESANLSGANLKAAILHGADFRSAKLLEANLENSNLQSAMFMYANLTGANLAGTSLPATKLFMTNLEAASVRETDFAGAILGHTVLSNVDLSNARHLQYCEHLAPSTVDFRTIAKSRDVPLVFWLGCGLGDIEIGLMGSLTSGEHKFQTCFISYSSKDQEFADQLYADLRGAGVPCWFAPHDLPIGAKTWDGIDEAIRTRDKLLLILSEGAIGSDWVEDEVTTAFAEERRRKELVLFPIRLDGSAMESGEPWARKLRDNRNIGDFTEWKDRGSYKVAFERVLRDLKAKR